MEAWNLFYVNELHLFYSSKIHIVQRLFLELQVGSRIIRTVCWGQNHK